MVLPGRRVFPRSNSAVTVTVTTAGGASHGGHVRNLSVGGAFIEMAVEVPTAARVGLALHLPGGALRCQGVVVRQIAPPGDATSYGIGVTFVDLPWDAASLLAAFVEEGLRSA